MYLSLINRMTKNGSGVLNSSLFTHCNASVAAITEKRLLYIKNKLEVYLVQQGNYWFLYKITFKQKMFKIWKGRIFFNLFSHCKMIWAHVEFLKQTWKKTAIRVKGMFTCLSWLLLLDSNMMFSFRASQSLASWHIWTTATRILDVDTISDACETQIEMNMLNDTMPYTGWK